MNTNGPILVLDDDSDDRDILESIFQKLGTLSARRYFDTPKAFLVYLQSTLDEPLIIFSDVNMAKQNGIALKTEINNDERLRDKSIPFVFLTTYANPKDVKSAFKLNSQGFFVKPPTYQEMCKMIDNVLCYWKDCVHPNDI